MLFLGFLYLVSLQVWGRFLFRIGTCYFWLDRVGGLWGNLRWVDSYLFACLSSNKYAKINKNCWMFIRNIILVTCSHLVLLSSEEGTCLLLLLHGLLLLLLVAEKTSCLIVLEHFCIVFVIYLVIFFEYGGEE